MILLIRTNKIKTFANIIHENSIHCKEKSRGMKIQIPTATYTSPSPNPSFFSLNLIFTYRFAKK